MIHIFKSLLFIVIISGVFILCVALHPPDFIQSERRPPARFPKINREDLASGKFMEDFEQAVADNFPFRENFRTLRAITVLGAFMQTDKNGLYIDKYGIGEIVPVDEKSVTLITEKINELTSELTGMNIFYAFIPDKSYYAENKLPGFNPATVRKLFTPNGRLIDITNTLNAESFYRTDLHWDQIKLNETATLLKDTMLEGITRQNTSRGEIVENFTESHAGYFRGVYSGQVALRAGEDNLNYLENRNLEAWYLNAQATAFEQGPVYDTEKLTGIDPYDFFLRGPQPLVVIENKMPSVDRELFIFRDSFSSSLAPLLAEAYSKVTLIDLRYINMTTVHRLIEMPSGSDVLFLYSSQILNRAEVLL